MIDRRIYTSKTLIDVSKDYPIINITDKILPVILIINITYKRLSNNFFTGG